MPAAVPLHAPPPPRTPERDRLAAAIARHRATTEYESRIAEATPRAWALISDARNAVEAAETALAEARADEPRLIAARLIGAVDAPAPQVEAAAAALAEAQGKLSVAERARDAVKTEADIAERDVVSSRRELDTSLQAVVAPSPGIALLLAEYRGRQRRLAELASLLVFLGGRGLLPDEARNWDALPREMTSDAERRAASDALQSLLAPWRTALEALEGDAGAPLPGDDDPAPAAA